MTKSQAESSRGLAAVLLAAGKSTRMKTDLPKVMHEVCGKPMLGHVLDACRDAGIEKFYVVVGFAKDAIIQAYDQQPGVNFVEQTEQKGTGHAVMMCREALAGFSGDCVVIAADMPLVNAETLKNLITAHRAATASASLATTVLDDPTGYGRIIRDGKGEFTGIVEHRDCSPAQLKITEVNPSYYCFDAEALFTSLDKITPNNAKGEYYITDTLSILRGEGKRVVAPVKLPAEDATGINSRAELAMVNGLMQRRIQAAWMESGVSIVDPSNTWIECDAQIGRDTVIRPFTFIERGASIGAGCTVGPFSHVAAGLSSADNTTIGPSATGGFDAAANRMTSQQTSKRTVQVVRRPPASSGCP